MTTGPGVRGPAPVRQELVRAPAALLLVSATGQVLMASDRMADMIGLTPDEMRSRPLQEFLGTGPLRDPATLDLHRLIEDCVISQAFRRPDGTSFAATASLTAIRGAGAAVTSVLVVVSPIGASHARERRTPLDDGAGRRQDLELATFSHELRTPLHAILGSVELLLEDLDGDLPRRRDLTHNVDISARHLLALVNDLLDILRLRNGKVLLDIEPVAVSDIIEGGLAFVRHAAAAKSITLLPPSGSAGIAIWTDARRSRQILVNLLDNAIKCTPEGGTVSLAVSFAPGQGVTFCVRDTGMGIRPELARLVFEPFEPATAAFVRAFGGTGLGLPVVKGLAEALGGSVTLRTEDGKGSEFVVWLPAGNRDVAASDGD